MRAILVCLLVGIIAGPMLLVGRPAVAQAAAVQAAAEDECLPSNRTPVTVLVRSAAGRPFEPIVDDADPFIDVRAGRTMVPMRGLFEALSPGVDAVQWDTATRTATFWYQGHTLAIHFGRGADRTYSATLDGRVFGMTSYLCDGRIWVPVRGVGDALKLSVEYFDGGLVMVDAVGNGSSSTGAEAPTTRTASACAPFPEDLVSYLLSPTASSRRAALAAACEIRQY